MPTPTQAMWLAYLAEHGATAWNDMPKLASGRAVGGPTWRRLRDDGLATAMFKRPPEVDRVDWYFDITEAGRQALARTP